MMKFGLIAAALAVGVMISGGSALAAGDVASGKKVFQRKCAMCHSVEKGKNKIGPSLFGVFGKKAGHVKGFRFSPAMKKSDLTLNEANLNLYLQNPRKVVKGTRMVFAGLRSKKDREDVIAYLKSLK